MNNFIKIHIFIKIKISVIILDLIKLIIRFNYIKDIILNIINNKRLIDILTENIEKFGNELKIIDINE